jgi:hypothetical protein
MKNSQKIFLMVIFCLTAGITHSDAVKNFINNFPFNIQYDTIYSDASKICMCGVNTQLLRNQNYGISIEMYRLVQADFSWIGAEKTRKRVTWSTMTLAKNYSGSTMWYGPGDASFASYQMQAHKMKGILTNYTEILKEGGINATVSDCTPYVSYYSAHFLHTISTGYIKKNEAFATQDARNAFASSHHFENYYDYEEKGKYKMSYPLDFTQVDVAPLTKNGLGIRGSNGGKLDQKGIKFIPRVNGVVCPIEIEAHGSAKKKSGAIVFYDKGETKKFFGTSISSFKFQYNNAIEFVADMEKNAGAHKPISGAVTSVDAFLFAHDAQEEEKLNDPGFIKENVLIPNTFDITFCYSILDPTVIGKYFAVEESEWFTIFNKYRLNCPVLSMNSGIVYQYRIQGQWQYFRYFGMIKRPDGLFDVTKGDLIPGDKGDIYDYYINPGSLDFAQHPEYNGRLEKSQSGQKEFIDAVQTEVEKVEEVVEDETVDISPIDFEEMKQEAKQQVNMSTQNDDEGPEESDHTVVDEVQEEIVLTPEEDEKVRICRLRREVIERKYAEANVVPETVTQVRTMINEMMQHPQKLLCTDLVIFIFSSDFVSLIDPPMVVMKWDVKEVDPKVLEANKEDPNKKVFEIRFYNDFFDDQKEILLYIPATELVNEWDKYSMILVDFHAWVASQMAEMLSLNGLFNAVYAAIRARLVNPYNEWDLSVGPSGPTKKSGSSGPSEFIEVGNLMALPYLNMTMRLSRSEFFYDLIYQSWEIGEKYYMMKISGTQLNFQVMINKFSTTAKLNQIYDALFRAIIDNFLGQDGVVSLITAKRTIFDILSQVSKETKFGFELNLLDLPGSDYEDPEIGHQNMKNSDDNAFMYSITGDLVGQSYTVRGFVHNRENIPVVNLFFSSDMFQSEYIVPLVSQSLFENYIRKVFTECFDHFVMLIRQVRLVENPGTPSDQIEEAQKLGQYTTKNLTDKILAMLEKRVIYGCVSEMNPSLSEVNVGSDGVPDPAKFEEIQKQQKKYKWSQPDGWDHTGGLMIRRSNKIFKGAASKCEEEEDSNPIIIHLYPTYLDGLAGYALTVNDVAKDGSKEYKTTYHFVKYQDYAHMRVLEHFINKIFDDIFDSLESGNEE